jgi:hypothetical protein
LAYIEISVAEIAVGEPTKNAMLTKVKDNLIDHEERIQDLEAGSATVYPPMELDIKGYYGDQGAAENWVKTVPNFNLTITGARLYIDQAGVSGTTEIDVLVSSSGGPYTSIFTTKPSVGFAAGNDAVSSNGVLNPLQVDVLAGDIIRLDTTSVQVDARNLLVRIDYIKN